MGKRPTATKKTHATIAPDDLKKASRYLDSRQTEPDALDSVLESIPPRPTTRHKGRASIGLGAVCRRCSFAVRVALPSSAMLQDSNALRAIFVD